MTNGENNVLLTPKYVTSQSHMTFLYSKYDYNPNGLLCVDSSPKIVFGNGRIKALLRHRFPQDSMSSPMEHQVLVKNSIDFFIISKYCPRSI